MLTLTLPGIITEVEHHPFLEEKWSSIRGPCHFSSSKENHLPQVDSVHPRWVHSATEMVPTIPPESYKVGTSWDLWGPSRWVPSPGCGPGPHPRSICTDASCHHRGPREGMRRTDLRRCAILRSSMVTARFGSTFKT